MIKIKIVVSDSNIYIIIYVYTHNGMETIKVIIQTYLLGVKIILSY
jgi:hypothetical protein